MVKWPEQPIRQHLRLSFDELFTAVSRTLFNSDSLESYGSERLSYLLGWPSLWICQGVQQRERGRGHLGRLAWHGPSATTSGSALRGLRGASYRPPQVRFCRLARSHGVRRGKRTVVLRQGRRSVRSSHQRRGLTAPSKNVPPHRDTAEDTTNDMTALRRGVYIGGDSWQDRGGQRFRRWRPPT